jgi:hypothetical protein
LGAPLIELKRLRSAPSQADKLTLSSAFAKNRSARHPSIAGESPDVGLVCSAGCRAGSAGASNRCCGFVAMTVVNNDGRLQGPTDTKRIDIHSPAEMRHWAREIGRPVAKLKEAVEAVGPLVSDVRDYLLTHTLYGKAR